MTSDIVGRFRFVAECPDLHTVEISIPSDSNISQTLDAFEAFLLAAGYSEQTVKNAMESPAGDAHL